jgi:hypothetical protein
VSQYDAHNLVLWDVAQHGPPFTMRELRSPRPVTDEDYRKEERLSRRIDERVIDLAERVSLSETFVWRILTALNDYGLIDDDGHLSDEARRRLAGWKRQPGYRPNGTSTTPSRSNRL